MGYFNYFIKCIIRNISYKLCKPKVFLTVLLSVIILFCLKHFGYCADFTSSQITQLLNDVNGIITEIKSSNAYLSSLDINTDSIENDVAEIENLISSIENDTSNISSDLNLLLSKIDTVNNSLSNLYAQQNIYYENVTDELEEIRKILIGAETETTGITLNGWTYFRVNPKIEVNNTNLVVSGSGNYAYTTFNYTFEKGYTYTFSSSISSSSNVTINYTYDTISLDNYFYAYRAYSGSSSSINFSITPTTNNTIRLITSNPSLLTGSTWTITKVSSSSLSGINSTLNQQGQDINNSINEGNQLQQEQNQLQQEQNDFLKQETSNSDVSVDSFNSVDSNDITSEGLTGVFTNIYNSINSWNSKDINLPIPYTNKNIVIPANYTQNMLSSFGGGWIITFISSIYYFIVARFIIYSITSIINSIKSGSILETDSKNNITTDML